MLSCVAIHRLITLKENQLTQLAKRAQGHSLQAQELLDEVAQLELDYRNQGCWTPPPPAGIATAGDRNVVVTWPGGGEGDRVVEIDCVNDGGVDTTVEYSIDPPIAGLTSVNAWTIPLPPGHSVQQAHLTVAVADDASDGAQQFYLTENVFFGPVHDLTHQQYDSVDPAASVIIGPNPAYTEIAARAAALGVAFTGSPLESVVRLDGPSPADTAAYRRRFTGCTIYYSPATGAHEIHGDIRAKYDLRYQSSPLVGIPIGDQRGCPDGRVLQSFLERGIDLFASRHRAICSVWRHSPALGSRGMGNRPPWLPHPRPIRA